MSMPAPAFARLAGAALLLLAGCSSVQVRRASCYVYICDRKERLIDSHILSNFTKEQIQRDGIASAAAKLDSGGVAQELVQIDGASPDPSRWLAIAELCYRQARKLDDLSPAPSLPWYRDAASWAARAAGSGNSDLFDRASNIHNRSIERLVRLSHDFRLRKGRSWPAVFADAGIELVGVNSFLNPPQYESLTVARDIVGRGMQTWYACDGFGVPLIAYRETERCCSGRSSDCFFPRDLRVGATAVLHPCDGGLPKLVFHDPFEERRAEVCGGCVPLANDRTAALAAHCAWAYFRSLGKLGLRRSQALDPEAGLHLFRPYQPGKIPVVLLHGLLSTPSAAWVQTFNHLQNDPELSQRYQFWFYFYPTGAPFALNAEHFRADLRRALATFDPGGTDPALQQIVLVGHSMGGLIAKMATQDSGMTMWDATFSVPPDELRVSSCSRKVLVESLFFQPVPQVRRLVFVATPHQGSNMANRPLGRMLEFKIKRDDSFTAAVRDAARENGNQALNPELVVHRIDGVGGLRPDNPLMQAAASLPISPQVIYHSIIPQIGTENCHFGTDLVVKYWSSHIEGAASEKITPGIHISTDRPVVYDEIRRILLEHLATGDPQPSAIQPAIPTPER